MRRQRNQKGTSEGPEDKSLEAYKTWFLELIKKFTKEGTDVKLSEAEWVASWQEYWKEQAQQKRK